MVGFTCRFLDLFLKPEKIHLQCFLYAMCRKCSFLAKARFLYTFRSIAIIIIIIKIMILTTLYQDDYIFGTSASVTYGPQSQDYD